MYPANATPVILGTSNEEVSVNSLEETKNATIEMVRQARFSIDIFTQDMDAEIYNNKDIEISIFRLARRQPNTCIRILVQDSKKAAQNGHCLIRLAQSLTSSVFIHNPSRIHRDEQCAFMIADRVGLIYRVSAVNKNYNTSINFMAARGATKMCNFFTEVWEHSTPDTQTRRLYV